MKLATTIVLLTSVTLFAQQSGILAERFKQLDKNGDGKITREEVPEQYRRLFDQLDKNKDGVLTREEVQAGVAGRLLRATAQPSTPSASAIELVRTLNIRYANRPDVDAKSQSLDVYAPKDAKGAPVLVMIHGGGWRGGDKGHSPVGENLAQRYGAEGFVFVSINYRLTPAGKHPANIQDVAKAVAWVHDHIAEHGGDPAQVFVMGHSAGGHLAALVAVDERWLKAEGKSLSILKGAVLLDPAAYDIPGYVKEDARLGKQWMKDNLYGPAFGDTEEAWRDASPQEQIAAGKNIPPMLMFYTAEKMYANKFAPAFAEALTKVGAPSGAVDTITLEHNEILSNAAVKEHPLAQLVLRFLKGEDATKFPDTLTTAAPAPPTPAPKPAPAKPATDAATAMFQRLDRNHDGKLTRDEIPRLFDQLDKNKDGVVTPEEAAAFRLPTRPAPATKPSASTPKPSASAETSDRANPSPLQITFTKDYFPGTKDRHGQFMGGTESMRLAAHNGMLFAGNGFWTDQPGNDPQPGAQILVKRGANESWEVERTFPGALRINCMEPVTFTTDHTGKPLPKPVTLLLADAALVTARDEGPLSVWVRDDKTSTWTESRVTSNAPRAYVRAFGLHHDRKTGVDLVFAGTGAGEVYVGTFDPEAKGRIRWNAKPEYTNPDFDGGSFRRCQGFCTANGKAYASIAPSLVERRDGTSPSWVEVFRWKPQEDRFGQGLRGITAVPALQGGHQVILGSREQEGRILRIDPRNNYRVELELESQPFLQEKLGSFRGGKLVAYNRFEPGKHPLTGAPIHWVTVAGYKPEDPKAAWLMIRHSNGTYEPFRVFDPNLSNHPTLISTRTLEFAPWSDREFYTGGYDGAANNRSNHNTAWIYKGTLPSTLHGKQ